MNPHDAPRKMGTVRVAVDKHGNRGMSQRGKEIKLHPAEAHPAKLPGRPNPKLRAVKPGPNGASGSG